MAAENTLTPEEVLRFRRVMRQKVGAYTELAKRVDTSKTSIHRAMNSGPSWFERSPHAPKLIAEIGPLVEELERQLRDEEQAFLSAA